MRALGRSPGPPNVIMERHSRHRIGLIVMTTKKTHTKKRRLTEMELLLASFKALMKAHRTGDPELIERATRVHDLQRESIELRNEWIRQQLREK